MSKIVDVEWCKRKRVDEDVIGFMNTNNKRQKNSATTPKKKNVTWAPLLVGKVPFGWLLKKMIPLCRRELEVRDAYAFDEIEEAGIRDLIKMMSILSL